MLTVNFALRKNAFVFVSSHRYCFFLMCRKCESENVFSDSHIFVM